MSASQFATFRLGDDLFGLDVSVVQEINRAVDITPVPHAPRQVRGLVNLRGRIVTVLDPGILLGLPRREITTESANIILKTGALCPSADAGAAFLEKDDSVGFLVDSLDDVVDAREQEIEPPPANVQDAQSRFFGGVVQGKEELVTILDPAALLRASTGEPQERG